MQKASNSSGLAFMLAAAGGAPRTLGDRERVALLSAAMDLAVRYRYRFEKQDAKALQGISIHTCVGVFRPLDLSYYNRACLAGGTYARLWEDHHDQKPWVAEMRIAAGVSRPYSGDWNVRHLATESGRVSPGQGFLLPHAYLPESPELEATLEAANGMQLWWCTSFDKDTLNLGRYKAGPREHGAGPVRKRRVTRAEWDTLQKGLKPAKPQQDPDFVLGSIAEDKAAA